MLTSSSSDPNSCFAPSHVLNQGTVLIVLSFINLHTNAFDMRVLQIHFNSCSLTFLVAMVSLESKAAWESRARAIGVPDGFISELKDSGLDTFGQWAFCCASDPSSSDDTPVKEAVQALIGREVTPQEMIYCRKLFFEGKTYAVSICKLGLTVVLMTNLG